MKPPRTPEKWKGDGLKPARRQPADPAAAYQSGVRAAALLIRTYAGVTFGLFALAAIGRLDGDQLVDAMKYTAIASVALAMAVHPEWLRTLLIKSLRRQLRAGRAGKRK